MRIGVMLLTGFLAACSPLAQRPERGAEQENPRRALEEYVDSRLPPGAKRIEQAWLLDGLNQAKQLPRADLAGGAPSLGKFAASDWERLGPFSSGGRTRTLTFQTDGSLWAGSVGGGVWRGSTQPIIGFGWAPTGSLELPNIANGTFAVKPNNPAIVLVGTGEGFGNFDAIDGVGIFRSTNGGATFDPTPLHTGFGGNVNDLIFGVTDLNVAYAATSSGIWRSIDAGATWSLFNPDGFFGTCYDLEIRTGGGPDHLLAACSGGSVFLNENANGTGTWTRTFGPTSTVGRIGLAAGINDSSIVYAVMVRRALGDSMHGGLDRILRSNDGGSTWITKRQVATNPATASLLLDDLVLSDAAGTLCNGDPPRNQGWYDLLVAVDPSDDNILFVGGVDLFRSNDGGSTFGMASRWWSSSSDGLHADLHAFAFSPTYNGSSNQQMWIGNDGGVWRTTNARATLATRTVADPRGVSAACGGTGLTFSERNLGYGVLQFYGGDVDYFENAIAGGTQDNGTWLAPLNSSTLTSWNQILGADGGPTHFNSNSPDYVIASTQYGGVHVTSDGGQNWANPVTGSGCPLFVNPVARDPNVFTRFYTSNGTTLIQNVGGGFGSWSVLGSPFPGSSCTTDSARVITAIEVMPGAPNVVFIGSNRGDVCYITDALVSAGAHTWTCDSIGSYSISAIAFDPAEAILPWQNRAIRIGISTFGAPNIASSSTIVPMNLNFNTQLNSTMPDVPITDLEYEPNPVTGLISQFGTPTTATRMYVATEVGLFSITSNSEGHRVAYESGSGLPKTRVDRVVRPKSASPYLYVFTHGLGAYRARLNQTFRSACSGAVSIPDATPGGVAVDINLPPTGEIVDINVFVQTNHTFLGDLKIDLVHPATNTRVNLVDRPLGGQCTANGLSSVTFDDSAADDADGACNGEPALTGTLRASEGFPQLKSLAKFHAVPASSGLWRLEARDYAVQDTGTIQFCVNLSVGLLADGFE